MKNNKIRYYSTNLQAGKVTFKEALLTGIAPDGGLFMPDSVPVFSKPEIEELSAKSYPEIAHKVLGMFLGSEIDDEDLLTLCRDAYVFPVPLEKAFDNTYIIRLDQGPTASFKDFAARMMARLMNYFISGTDNNYTILTATSGDTGSAVASAFHGLSNIKVVILFPLHEVTGIQRKQMTTLGCNINVIAVDGKFDDCQHYAKKIFSDPGLKGFHLSSANSINIGRLLPQSVYYFFAWSRIADSIKDSAVFSVPSGNLGNLMGGIIAREMGLPVKKFIIATNMNSEVPEYLRKGVYRTISPSINCISSAMNVGHPGNLARIIALYGGRMDEKGTILEEPDLMKMRNDFYGTYVSDNKTLKTISECYHNYGLILEPHGAVAWHGLEDYLENDLLPGRGQNYNFILETAHPSKFRDILIPQLGFSPEVPEMLSDVEDRKENYIIAENNYEIIRKIILRLLK